MPPAPWRVRAIRGSRQRRVQHYPAACPIRLMLAPQTTLAQGRGQHGCQDFNRHPERRNVNPLKSAAALQPRILFRLCACPTPLGQAPDTMGPRPHSHNQLPFAALLLFLLIAQRQLLLPSLRPVNTPPSAPPLLHFSSAARPYVYLRYTLATPNAMMTRNVLACRMDGPSSACSGVVRSARSCRRAGRGGRATAIGRVNVELCG